MSRLQKLLDASTRGTRMGALFRPARWTVLTGSLLSLLVMRVLLEVWAEPPVYPAGTWIGRFEGIPFASGNAIFRPIIRQDQLSGRVSPEQACKDSVQPWRLQLSGLKRRLDGQRYLPGACVVLELREPRAQGPSPGSGSLWSFRHRIVARMQVVTAVRYLDAETDAVELARLEVREKFEALQASGSGKVSIPIMLGLVTGDRVLLKPWMWDIFSRTGTSHLMSISGSHVTSLAALAYMGGLLLARQSVALSRVIPAQHVALMFALTTAVCYGLLAGMNVPTQRTLAMMAGAMIAKVRGGSLLSWQALGFAAIAVITIDPLAVLDVGAWLSFSAVALIMLVTSGHVLPLGAARTWVRVQLALFVGLAPVSVAVFGGFSVVGPVANALAIPLMGLLIVPASLAMAAVLEFAPGLSESLLAPVDVLITALFRFLEWLSQAEWAMVRTVPLDPFVAVFCSLSAVLLLLPVSAPARLCCMLMLTPAFLGPGCAGDRHALHLSSSRKWDALFETPSGVMRILQSGGLGSAESFRRWASAAGFIIPGQAQVAEWTAQGFMLAWYEKVSGLPGQVSLQLRNVMFPCVPRAEPYRASVGIVIRSLRLSENECWLALEWRDESMLLADSLDRESQLRVASEPWAARWLAISPASDERLLGAMLSRPGLEGVIFGPGSSSRYPDQSEMFAARSLRRITIDSHGDLRCGPLRQGWQTCLADGLMEGQKN